MAVYRFFHPQEGDWITLPKTHDGYATVLAVPIVFFPKALRFFFLKDLWWIPITSPLSLLSTRWKSLGNPSDLLTMRLEFC